MAQLVVSKAKPALGLFVCVKNILPTHIKYHGSIPQSMQTFGKYSIMIRDAAHAICCNTPRFYYRCVLLRHGLGAGNIFVPVAQILISPPAAAQATFDR